MSPWEKVQTTCQSCPTRGPGCWATYPAILISHWLRASLVGVNPSSPLPRPSQEHTCGLRTLGAAARSTPEHGTHSIRYTHLQPEQVTASTLGAPFLTHFLCTSLSAKAARQGGPGRAVSFLGFSAPLLPSLPHQPSLVAVHPMGGSTVRYCLIILQPGGKTNFLHNWQQREGPWDPIQWQLPSRLLPRGGALGNSLFKLESF